MNNRRIHSITSGSILFAACLFANSALAQTEIPNGDFEDLYNPLASWNTHGQVSVVQDLRDAYSFPAGFGDGNEYNKVNILDLITLQICFSSYDIDLAPDEHHSAYSHRNTTPFTRGEHVI